MVANPGKLAPIGKTVEPRRELLNSTGIGSHPELIRFALRVGRRLGRSL